MPNVQRNVFHGELFGSSGTLRSEKLDMATQLRKMQTRLQHLETENEKLTQQVQPAFTSFSDAMFPLSLCLAERWVSPPAGRDAPERRGADSLRAARSAEAPRCGHRCTRAASHRPQPPAERNAPRGGRVLQGQWPDDCERRSKEHSRSAS